MACPHCGSWSVKADRSLAGRLVCGRCGRALGIRPERPSRTPGRWSIGAALQATRLRWWVWLGALVAVSALLASLSPPPRHETPARPGASQGQPFL